MATPRACRRQSSARSVRRSRGPFRRSRGTGGLRRGRLRRRRWTSSWRNPSGACAAPSDVRDSAAVNQPEIDPSFEDAVKRLSEIVQTLERGDLPLEESLRLFEEGVKLSRASQAKLDSAQRRVEELLG